MSGRTWTEYSILLLVSSSVKRDIVTWKNRRCKWICRKNGKLIRTKVTPSFILFTAQCNDQSPQANGQTPPRQPWIFPGISFQNNFGGSYTFLKAGREVHHFSQNKGIVSISKVQVPPVKSLRSILIFSRWSSQSCKRDQCNYWGGVSLILLFWISNDSTLWEIPVHLWCHNCLTPPRDSKCTETIHTKWHNCSTLPIIIKSLKRFLRLRSRMKELIEHGKEIYHLSSWLIFLIIVVIIPACLKTKARKNIAFGKPEFHTRNQLSKSIRFPAELLPQKQLNYNWYGSFTLCVCVRRFCWLNAKDREGFPYLSLPSITASPLEHSGLLVTRSVHVSWDVTWKIHTGSNVFLNIHVRA